MITAKNAIDTLQKRYNELINIHDAQRFNEWKIKTLQTLGHIYGADHNSYSALKNINSFSYSDRTINAIREATELIKGLIEDLDNLGLPIIFNNNTPNVNLNISQQNTQLQTTNISINLDILIDILKDELKGSQIKELKAIIESNESLEEKKKSFFDKIKSFGADIASNVLANLLTNPNIYEQILLHL
ncbi:hypothetical protein [Aquirufa antheringensis]|uniref:hypothetical protein n=1 Tax=Aquirufa antheringensis TaxID=2516559 RepID=UPI001032CB8B|nr:hypothetical protein [Aquirufa antheringensis]TBH71453.1 hypothetical protein EWU21_03945 [Aquirufa antheringensis]